LHLQENTAVGDNTSAKLQLFGRLYWQLLSLVLRLFPVAANRSKPTVQLSEICHLCLCTKKMCLPLYNTTENLHEKFHSISSTVKVNCSSEVQLYLTHLMFTDTMNINILNFVRFKAFLTVSMKMWMW